MRLLISLIALTCIFVMPVHFTATGQQSEKTLLWRISGNGMQSPSYLFGTIHLKTKKLFNFPDSLYAAIGSTDVFALELNPDSMNNMVAGYMERILDKKETSASVTKKEKTLKEILTPAELKILRGNLPPDSEIDPNELTVKQVYMMKDKLNVQKPRKDDLPTFMDAYLYGIAKDKGRMIAGIEHFEDQMNAFEKIDMSSTDPKKMVSYFNNGSSVQEQMIRMYIAKDLQGLQKISTILPEQQEELLLTVRNRNMLRSMDSIMKQHSLFCAVGALHLPGSRGLISLLRAKGYTVEPVISNTFINGADYKFITTKEQKWVDVVSEKDGYSIKMPGMPNDVAAAEGLVMMKLYYDINTSTCYLTNHTGRGANNTVSTSDVMDSMVAAMMRESKAQDVVSKPITNGGLTGKELTFTGKSAINYKLQVVGNATDIYMLTVYSQAAIRNTDSFFNTFKLIPKLTSTLVAKAFDDILLNASVPDYKPTRTVSYSTDSSNKQISYTIVDASTGNYYFIICNEAGVGYNFNDDTLFLHNITKHLDGQNIASTSKPGRFQGHKSYDIITETFQGMKMKTKLVFCGNRSYNILAQFPDNEKCAAMADMVLASVRINSPLPELVHQQANDSGIFCTYVPDSFITATVAAEETDSLHPTTSIYTCRDKHTLVTYKVSVKRLNPYYWKGNDTVMLKTWLAKSLVYTDSTATYSYSNGGDLIYGEMVAYKKQSDKIHRVRAISDGRTRYLLDCTYPTYLQDDRRIGSFYTSFRVLKKDKTALQTSPALLFAHMHSHDSLISAGAYASLNEVNFTKDDVPLLLKEATSTYPDDSLPGRYTIGIILNQLENFSNDITPTQLDALYHNPAIIEKGKQFEVMNMILQQKDSVAGYATIKHLLLTATPAKGAQYTTLYQLKREPKLAKTLYPELMDKCADSGVRFLVCNLASYLLDSGYLDRKEFTSYGPMLIAKSKQLRQKPESYDASLLHLLSYVDTKEALDEIRQYQYTNGQYLKYAATGILIDRKQTPDAAAIDSMAADKDYRLSIYNLLNDKNVPELFPQKYKTQDSFAECYLRELDEDGMYGDYTFIGTKTAMYKDQKQRFYLYRVEEADDKKTPHLGIAGPFSRDSKIAIIGYEDNACGVFYHELDIKNIDNQLKVYLIKKKIADSKAEEYSD